MPRPDGGLLAKAVGWSIFVIALSFWSERAIEHLPVDPVLMVVVIVPIIEELAKFIAYRGLKGQWTLVIPIMAVIAEVANRHIESADYSVETIFVLSLLSIAVMKHIAFWTPERLFDFRLFSLPMAITIHSIWNYFAISPTGSPGEGVSAGLIALATILFAVVLLKKYPVRDARGIM